jgi:hypothetical protein
MVFRRNCIPGQEMDPALFSQSEAAKLRKPNSNPMPHRVLISPSGLIQNHQIHAKPSTVPPSQRPNGRIHQIQGSILTHQQEKDGEISRNTPAPELRHGERD